MEAVLESQVVGTGTHGSIPEGERKEREERRGEKREEKREEKEEEEEKEEREEERRREERGERRIRLKQIICTGVQSMHFLKRNISPRISTTVIVYAQCQQPLMLLNT